MPNRIYRTYDELSFEEKVDLHCDFMYYESNKAAFKSFGLNWRTTSYQKTKKYKRLRSLLIKNGRNGVLKNKKRTLEILEETHD